MGWWKWNFTKTIIAYHCFDDAHSAQNICRIIHTILEEYRLVNRIFSISFDNVFADTASITELKNICQPNFGGRFFHVKCACHVLNLWVQDDIRAPDTFLELVRNVISYIWVHHWVIKTWLHLYANNGKTLKHFSKDIPTHWNATYKLLNQSFEYKDLLCSFASTHIQ